MKNVNKVILILLALLCVTFIGCENAAKTEGPSNTIVQNTGYFIDAPVAGLAYETSSGIKDVTDETGAYKYNAGDKVKFLIGNAQLGKEIEASPVVTPCTLTGATTIEDKTTDGKPTEAAKEALNMVKMFMALDSDDSDFGIKIPENLNTETLTTEDLDALIKADDFDTRASEVINEIVGEKKEIPNDEEAKKHYNQVAGQIDGEENLSHHQKLLESVQSHLKYYSDDKLTVATYLPEGITYVYYHFSADQKITKVGRSSTLSNNESIRVTGFDSDFLVDNINYGLTITALQDKSRFTVGDLVCHYNGTYFQKKPVDNYPIPIDFDKQRIVYADFTSDKHTAKIENVYKVSGTITVNDIENLGIADGQTLNSSPFSFFVHMDDDMVSLRNPILSTTKENGKIVFTYETYLPSEITELEISYKPFNSNDYHFNDSLSNMNLSSDITHNFEMSIRYGNEDDSTEDPVTPPAEGGDDNTEDPVTPPTEGGDDNTEDPVTPPAGDDDTDDPVAINNFAGKTFVKELEYLQFNDDGTGIMAFVTMDDNTQTFELEKIEFTYTVENDIASITFFDSSEGSERTIFTSTLENGQFSTSYGDENEFISTYQEGDLSLFEEWRLFYNDEELFSTYLTVLLSGLNESDCVENIHYTKDSDNKIIYLTEEGFNILLGDEESDTENPSEPTPDLPESVGEDVLAGTSWKKEWSSYTEEYVFGNDGTVTQTSSYTSGKVISRTYNYTIDTTKKFVYLQETSSTTVLTYPYTLTDTELQLYSSYYGEDVTLETLNTEIGIGSSVKLSSGGRLKASTDDNGNIVLTFLDADGTTVTKTITSTSVSNNTITWDTGDESSCTVIWSHPTYKVNFSLENVEYTVFARSALTPLTKQ